MSDYLSGHLDEALAPMDAFMRLLGSVRGDDVEPVNIAIVGEVLVNHARKKMGKTFEAISNGLGAILVDNDGAVEVRRQNSKGKWRPVTVSTTAPAEEERPMVEVEAAAIFGSGKLRIPEQYAQDDYDLRHILKGLGVEGIPDAKD